MKAALQRPLALTLVAPLPEEERAAAEGSGSEAEEADLENSPG